MQLRVQQVAHRVEVQQRALFATLSILVQAHPLLILVERFLEHDDGDRNRRSDRPRRAVLLRGGPRSDA